MTQAEGPSSKGVGSTPDTAGLTPIASLGLYTITSYGTWAYGFGVLLEPIAADTGWSATFLGAIYGWAMAISGIGAFWTGRLLDRFGSIAPFGIHAVVSSALMALALLTDSRWLFAVLFATGAGLAGATGFYTTTTVMVARIRSDRPDWSINALTVVGAFSSPIYLPLTAWLVTVWPWRQVAAVLVALGALGALQGAVLARGAASPDTGQRASPNPAATLRRAVSNPHIRRILAVYLLAGAAASTIWVYQVPIMVGAGLSLGAAGAIGGARGVCQLLGRLGLARQIERRGTNRLLQGAYAATAMAGLTLVLGAAMAGGAGLDSPPVVVAAVGFAVLAGVGLGAASPLQAIHARARFEPGDLGLLMGLQGLVLGVAGGLGPFAGALLRDTTGSWTATVLTVAAGLIVAATVLQRMPPEPAQPS